MSDKLNFESRSGKIKCNTEEAFAFVTDIRNFERFILAGTVENSRIDRESCSFNVPMLGNVSLKLADKERFTKVIFEGEALNNNDFTLVLNIRVISPSVSEVKVLMTAELNPIMKMIAVKPINQFLEMLINEMEGFSGWKDTME